MTRTVAARWEATDVERVFREVYGQAVATLVRLFGDITLAEDSVREAFVVAGDRWRSDGIPPNPAGWIATTHDRLNTRRRSAPSSGEQTEPSRVTRTTGIVVSRVFRRSPRAAR